jgi:CBS domain-containing protein
MQAEHILRRKGRNTVTIAPDATLEDAADTLSSHNIGALVVTDDGRVVGVFSERDLVRQISERGPAALRLSVDSVLEDGAEVPTCTPDDDVKDLMAFVTRERVRHLPVLEDGALNGIISVGDLLKHRLEEMETEKQVLRERLMGS